MVDGKNLYERIYTKRSTLLLCIAVWILIYLTDLPTHAGWTTTRFSDTFFVCTLYLRPSPPVFLLLCLCGRVHAGRRHLSLLTRHLPASASFRPGAQSNTPRKTREFVNDKMKNGTKESPDHAKLQSRPCGNNRRSFDQSE